jgi:hypothetical protein
MQSAAFMAVLSPGNVNFFHRHRDKSPEETKPAIEPLPLLKETPPADTVTPITLSPLQEANLVHALHSKVARVLNDLSVDGPGSKVPAVVGGAGRSSSASPRSISSDSALGTPII